MAIERLEPFVGRWEVEISLAPGVKGFTTFEWDLGGQFLIQRAGVPEIPEAPDGLCVIAATDDGGFRQHYFDSRGVVRLYKMKFEGGVWELWRDEPDFSPLGFLQRFTGRFSEDGRTIDGHWERTEDDGAWVTDFHGTYTKVG